jgi:hypothetical protein
MLRTRVRNVPDAMHDMSWWHDASSTSSTVILSCRKTVYGRFFEVLPLRAEEFAVWEAVLFEFWCLGSLGSLGSLGTGSHWASRFHLVRWLRHRQELHTRIAGIPKINKQQIATNSNKMHDGATQLRCWRPSIAQLQLGTRPGRLLRGQVLMRCRCGSHGSMK